MISRWWWGPKTAGGYGTRTATSGRWTERALDTPCSAPKTRRSSRSARGSSAPTPTGATSSRGLVERFRVLFWNYRGVGVSELPRWPGFHALDVHYDELGMEANARDLHAILDAEQVASSALVSHSMGVQVVLDTYQMDQERFAGLVSIAGAYRTPLRTFYGTDLSARVVPYALPLLHLFPRVTLLAWRAALRGPCPIPSDAHCASSGTRPHARTWRGTSSTSR